MIGLLLSIIVAVTTPSNNPVQAAPAVERRLAGTIYFTNNTPRERNTFPVELYTRDQKRLVLATVPNDGSFEFTGVKPGKYLLKLTWPQQCTLKYKIDLRKESLDKIRIVMDAACAHDNGRISNLPRN